MIFKLITMTVKLDDLFLCKTTYFKHLIYLLNLKRFKILSKPPFLCRLAFISGYFNMLSILHSFLYSSILHFIDNIGE